MMRFEGKRIHVVVTDAARLEAFTRKAKQLPRRQVLPSGDIREHSLESLVKSLVIDDAMRKLQRARRSAGLSRTVVPGDFLVGDGVFAEVVS